MTRRYEMQAKESTGAPEEHNALQRGRWLAVAAGLFLLAAAGCTSNPPVGTWEGPSAALTPTIAPWTDAPACVPPGGRVVGTPHYLIYTTMTDDDFLKQTAQVMEGALGEYRRLAPGARAVDSPMKCYLFSDLAEWESYTIWKTRDPHSIYLQITRGGYCIGDEYVAYNIGQASTLSVAAHEGWHQFRFRTFIGALPPFLEEGLATTFETIRWDRGLPQWNLSINGARVLGLREAIEDHATWPLETLITLDAGKVVTGSREKIEAFYSQSWAFADFLYNGDNKSRRPALLRMIADAAAGTIRDPTGYLRHGFRQFNPAGCKPLLVDYLGGNLKAVDQSFADIDTEYQAYIHQLAYEGLNSQYPN